MTAPGLVHGFAIVIATLVDTTVGIPYVWEGSIAEEWAGRDVEALIPGEQQYVMGEWMVDFAEGKMQ